MDAKITMSFDADIIKKAKEYAEQQGMSLSRLTEILLRKATSKGGYGNIEDIPVADWVTMVSEGESEYVRPRKKKAMKDEFYKSRK